MPSRRGGGSRRGRGGKNQNQKAKREDDLWRVDRGGGGKVHHNQRHRQLCTLVGNPVSRRTPWRGGFRGRIGHNATGIGGDADVKKRCNMIGIRELRGISAVPVEVKKDVTSQSGVVEEAGGNERRYALRVSPPGRVIVASSRAKKAPLNLLTTSSQQGGSVEQQVTFTCNNDVSDEFEGTLEISKDLGVGVEGAKSDTDAQTAVTVKTNTDVEVGKSQLQCQRNLESFTVKGLLDWILPRAAMAKSNSQKLLGDILQKKCVFVAVQMELDRVRENDYLMTNKSLEELFSAVLANMREVVGEELRQIRMQYNDVLEILTPSEKNTP